MRTDAERERATSPPAVPDAQPEPAAASPAATNPVARVRAAAVRIPVRTRWAVLLIGLLGVLIALPSELPADARIALFAFGAATVLWTLTDLEPGYVAVGAGLLACVPAGRQEEFFASLGHDVVWLVIGAFVIGGAMAGSGLASRLAGAIIGRARSVRGLMWMVTAAIVPLSFLVPSTSGRAAVLLPAYRSLSERLADRRIDRALALLMPTVVLVSTTCTLVGATSHLIAVDLLRRTSGETISYAAWALWGVPFGIMASAVACIAVQLMFLRREERRRPVDQLPGEGRRGSAAEAHAPMSRAEGVVGVVVGLALIGWLTEAAHGLGIATITILAAVVLCVPVLGAMTWKDGLRSVSWPLVLFVAGALALGGALVDSGAGDWIVAGLFALSGVNGLASTFALVLVIAVLSVTAHLYVTSHTVRAIALVPPFLYLAASADLSPVAVVFLVSIGIDYCLTLPVSSKALLVFTTADDRGAGFVPRDLLRLSAVLMPAYIVLMVIVYELWWKHTGLAL